MKKSIVFSWLLITGALFSGCQNNSKQEAAADGYTGATQKSNSNRIATSNSDWWPNQLNLSILRHNSSLSNPMGEDINYVDEFNSLDYEALKKDIEAVMTDSQGWWPADYGHYGGLFIRMAWHSAGTYRTGDGRGGSRSGQQRFAPLNSWPDNANLDKARRLLWPIKQKYGDKISWADLMVLTGNVALESMGFKTFGFAGGREDVYEPELDVYWGAPQKDWEVNNPEQLEQVLGVLETIQADFNEKSSGKKVSMADLIVLAGNAGVEKAAANAGFTVKVPFIPGRMDATQEQTDVESIALLEPMADGFRNYLKTQYTISTEELLLDKAQLLTLTAPEMTVLVGGMRALNANYDGSEHGIFSSQKDALTNHFFVHLLDMSTEWKASSDTKETFEGRDRMTGDLKWTATRADLIFGSNSELRALAEVYASEPSKEKFVTDFVAAWDKVMKLDRFDLIYQ